VADVHERFAAGALEALVEAIGRAECATVGVRRADMDDFHG
jgi:hypothetical protein